MLFGQLDHRRISTGAEEDEDVRANDNGSSRAIHDAAAATSTRIGSEMSSGRKKKKIILFPPFRPTAAAAIPLAAAASGLIAFTPLNRYHGGRGS